MNKRFIWLLLLCLLLAGCEGRDAQQERDVRLNIIKPEKISPTVSGDLSVSVNEPAEEDDPEEMGTTRDDVVQAFRSGYSRLIETRDVIAAYCADESVPGRDEVLAGVNRADELIGRIDAEDFEALRPSEVAAYFDEMTDVMDILTKVNEPSELTKADVAKLQETLAGSIWIDDDINTYMLDKNGRNMYIALAGDDKPYGGTYSIESSKGNVTFVFTIPNLKTEVKAQVTRFDEQAFCFTDQNTGDEFYLMPVKR